VGEETPGPALSRRVPGATRDGPAPSVQRRLPDSLMERMQAAVDAARGADADGAEVAGDEVAGDAVSGGPAEGRSFGGSNGSGGLNGADGANGVSALPGLSGVSGVSGVSGGWSEQEPITEPLPNLQAALAALDLARQYGSVPAGPWPVQAGPGSDPSRSESAGRPPAAEVGRAALPPPPSGPADPDLTEKFGRADVPPGTGVGEDRAAWWEHATQPDRPRPERSGRGNRQGRARRTENPASSGATGSLAPPDPSETSRRPDAPWDPARARRERSRWNNRTGRRDRSADIPESPAVDDRDDSPVHAHPWTHLDPSWLVELSSAPAESADPAPPLAHDPGVAEDVAVVLDRAVRPGEEPVEPGQATASSGVLDRKNRGEFWW